MEDSQHECALQGNSNSFQLWTWERGMWVWWTIVRSSSAYFSLQGNSNSLSTVDVGAGYVGLVDYSPVIIDLLLITGLFQQPVDSGRGICGDWWTIVQSSSAYFSLQGNSNSLSMVDVGAGYVGLVDYSPVIIDQLLITGKFQQPVNSGRGGGVCGFGGL